MKADSVKIADGVYWVGALDWDARDFHGFAVPGMTYNAYLVFGDEKVALIDNVYDGFYPEMWARIEDAFAKEQKEKACMIFLTGTTMAFTASLILSMVIRHNAAFLSTATWNPGK